MCKISYTNLIKYLSAVILFLCTIQLYGQDDGKLKVVQLYHEEGADLTYEGYISKLSTQDTLFIYVVKAGKIVEIPRAQVLSIKDKVEEKEVLDEADRSAMYEDLRRDLIKYGKPRYRPYDFPDNVLYGRIELDFHQQIMGIGASMGYRLNRMFSIGLGLSLSSWDWDPQPSGVTSIFAQSLGYFTPTNNSFYYIWEAGISLPRNPRVDDWSNYARSDPGFYGSVGIGWRWRGAASIQNSLEMGFQYTDLTYYGLNSISIERNYHIGRFYFTIGTMF